MNRKLLFISAFCAYLAAVLALCLIRTDGMPQTDFSILGIPADKLTHFIMFLPFPILAYSAFYKAGRKKVKETAMTAAMTIAGFLLACITEYLQSLTSYRTSDPTDIHADLIGVSLGAIIILLYIIFRKRP